VEDCRWFCYRHPECISDAECRQGICVSFRRCCWSILSSC